MEPRAKLKTESATRTSNKVAAAVAKALDARGIKRSDPRYATEYVIETRKLNQQIAEFKSTLERAAMRRELAIAKQRVERTKKAGIARRKGARPAGIRRTR